MVAVNEVDMSSDHRSDMLPSSGPWRLPSLAESCAASVTLGKYVAVTVTVVPPADETREGSTAEMVGVWGCTITVALKMVRALRGATKTTGVGVSVRLKVPAEVAGKVMVTARELVVECSREMVGVEARGGLTVRVRASTEATVT